jgi:hypothetical protein
MQNYKNSQTDHIAQVVEINAERGLCTNADRLGLTSAQFFLHCVGVQTKNWERRKFEGRNRAMTSMHALLQLRPNKR